MKAAFATILLWVLPVIGQACERAICLSSENAGFTQIITFREHPSGLGPGRQVDGLLLADGAMFGERFAGQVLGRDAEYDVVSGPAVGPLELLAGEANSNLSVLRVVGTNVLSGDGPTGAPRNDATGEGSISILFDSDQAGVRLDLRGGEGGTATILFLNRSGTVIDTHDIAGLGEMSLVFLRDAAIEDIAGIVLNNRDPEGIALDEVAFGFGPQTS